MIVSDSSKLKGIKDVTSADIINHALVTTIADEYFKFVLKSEQDFSEPEKYIVDVYRKISAINECVKNIECSLLFLDKMFSFKFPMLSKISKSQYMNYHYEMFLTKAISLRDILYHNVNVFFKCNLSNPTSRDSKELIDQFLKKNGYLSIFDVLDSHLSLFDNERAKRNCTIHQGEDPTSETILLFVGESLEKLDDKFKLYNKAESRRVKGRLIKELKFIRMNLYLMIKQIYDCELCIYNNGFTNICSCQSIKKAKARRKKRRL